MGWLNTEAYEASNGVADALQRFEEQLRAYRGGRETFAVVAMYEEAALSHGATHAMVADVWERNPRD